MSILTQLLIILIVFLVAYMSYLSHKGKYEAILAVFPDFGKLFRAAGPAADAHAAHDDDHADAHEAHGTGIQAAAAAHSGSPLPAPSASVKVVVYVPDAHADAVRQAIGEAGGGIIGNYTFCTFSSLGTGRYMPGAGANPMIGSIGVHERVEEERIEFTCNRQNLQKVVSTIKKVHPYEEIVIDIYPLEAHPELEGRTAAQGH